MCLEYWAAININEGLNRLASSTHIIIWVKLALIPSSLCISNKEKDESFNWWEVNVNNHS